MCLSARDTNFVGALSQELLREIERNFIGSCVLMGMGADSFLGPIHLQGVS